MTEAAVVRRDRDLPMSKFAVVIAFSCQVGPYIRPGVGVVDEITVRVHIKSGFLQASLGLGLKHFDPHGVFEGLDRPKGFVAFCLFHRGDSVLDKLDRRFVVPYFAYAVFDKVLIVGAEAFDGEKEGWAVHLWGGDSKCYVLGCPHGLLSEDLVVNLA